jgi:hypothetical protein
MEIDRQRQKHPMVYCFHCGEPGHKKPDCPKLRQGQGQQVQQQNFNGSSQPKTATQKPSYPPKKMNIRAMVQDMTEDQKNEVISELAKEMDA